MAAFFVSVFIEMWIAEVVIHRKMFNVCEYGIEFRLYLKLKNCIHYLEFSFILRLRYKSNSMCYDYCKYNFALQAPSTFYLNKCYKSTLNGHYIALGACISSFSLYVSLKKMLSLFRYNHFKRYFVILLINYEY